MASDSIFFLLFHDADGHWYAAPPGFQTLLRHPIGQGCTRLEAIDALVAHPEFVDRAKRGEWAPKPRLVDFIEADAPPWTTWTPFTNIDFLAEAATSAPAEPATAANTLSSI